MRRKVTDAQIIRALKQTGGNQSAAARKLGVSRACIQQRLRRIDPKKVPPSPRSGSVPKKKRPPEINDSLWQEYRRHPKSSVLENQLVTRYFGLATRVFWAVQTTLPAHTDIDVLQSGAYSGLLEAIRHFDPSRKVRFSTYAPRVIRGRILDGLRTADHHSRRVRQRQRQRMDTKESLLKALGRHPTETEVADSLGWQQSEIDESRAPDTVSIHTPYFETDSGGVLDLAATLEDRGRQSETRQERLDFYRWILHGLNIEEQIIVYLSYAKGVTLKEIGKCLCLSESRTSQVRAASLANLKRWRKKGVCYDEVGEL